MAINKEKLLVFEILQENSSVSSYQEKMMAQFKLWSNFKYSDWISYLDYIKSNPLKLYAFLPFVTKIIGIEIVPEFYKLKDLQDETENYVKGIHNHHYYSINSIDLNFYNRYKIEIEAAFTSRMNLIEQGAIPVEEYEIQHRVSSNGIVNRYSMKIKRREFTSIGVEEIEQIENLVRTRKIIKRG